MIAFAGVRLSTVLRFVAAAFLVQFGMLAAMLLFVMQAGERQFDNFSREWVQEMQTSLVDIHRLTGRAGIVAEIRDRLADPGAATILLADRDGTPIIGNLKAWPATLPDSSDWRSVDLYRTGARAPQSVLLITTLLPDGSRLLTGRALGIGAPVTSIYRDVIIIGFVLSLLAAIASAYVLGRMLAGQLETIVRTTRVVADGGLSARVPLSGAGDAFDHLRSAFNAMLERIDGLVEELRLTTDGLAHDLKSPLTRLHSAIEAGRDATQDPAALAAFDRIDTECDQLTRMLSTALLISRTDSGLGSDMMTTVDVALLLTGIAELYEPLGEDAHVAISADAPAGLVATLYRPLIEQALGNLVDNALRYATGASRIMLSARIEGNRIELIVADDGVGIPAERHAEALRRFGRLDAARSSAGSGLGLALVAAVARLHKGTIALEDNQPGLRVILALPG